jgi:hypothetical protein
VLSQPVPWNQQADDRTAHAGKLRVIAEPGRYYAEACAHYACYINGWRRRALPEGGATFDYYITDGLYGSMNWWVGRAPRCLPNSMLDNCSQCVLPAGTYTCPAG